VCKHIYVYISEKELYTLLYMCVPKILEWLSLNGELDKFLLLIFFLLYSIFYKKQRGTFIIRVAFLNTWIQEVPERRWLQGQVSNPGSLPDPRVHHNHTAPHSWLCQHLLALALPLHPWSSPSSSIAFFLFQAITHPEARVSFLLYWKSAQNFLLLRSKVCQLLHSLKSPHAPLWLHPRCG
jgi:hypothetical protein